jgi:hypothetical protein
MGQPVHGGDGDADARSHADATDQRLQARELAHDVRNALNGAAVNLEAARAKAERGEVAAQDLVPFLSRVAEQIDAVARLSKTAFTMLNDALEEPATKDSHTKNT